MLKIQDNVENSNLIDGEIIKYINPCANTRLSEMSGLDVQDLLSFIEEYYLNLRRELGFSSDITFGLELEFEKSNNDAIKNELKELFLSKDKEWIFVEDDSLFSGGEINSPILTDNEEAWNDLLKVCLAVEPHASIFKNSGGHIHVGTQVLGDKKESWLNFIKLWSIYENIIYRFSYGEYLTARPCISRYAKPMSTEFMEYYLNNNKDDEKLEDLLTMLTTDKNQAVNFKNVLIDKIGNFDIKNTIEFRCPNGTLNPIVWQNNVNLFVNLLKYSKSSSFNEDILEKRYLLNSDNFTDIDSYDEIYLDQAFELCDMIFDNNLDKLYFLKQYLKSFKVSNDRENFSKTRCLLVKE